MTNFKTNKYDFSGLSTKSYLTRSLLNKIFNKILSNNEVDELILSGLVTKKFSYYTPTETLLRQLKVIPFYVIVPEHEYGRLAKKSSFVLKELQEIFQVKDKENFTTPCNKDTVKLVVEHYFYRKYNYYYKNDILNDKLLDGEERFEV